jgi:hypothetical protein
LALLRGFEWGGVYILPTSPATRKPWLCGDRFGTNYVIKPDSFGKKSFSSFVDGKKKICWKEKKQEMFVVYRLFCICFYRSRILKFVFTFSLFCSSDSDENWLRNKISAEYWPQSRDVGRFGCT